MHRIILLMTGLFGLLHAEDIPALSSELVVKPKVQIAEENQNVVIDCIHRKNLAVRWYLPNTDIASLHANKVQKSGRLIIYSIKYSDEGTYTCYNEDYTQYAVAQVIVRRPATTGYEKNLVSWFVTSGLPATQRPLNFVTNITSTPYPCIYGTCNGTCCKGESSVSYFDCANGQKINKTLVCNRENDCDDGSDESECSPWPPKITALPKHEVKVFCGDQEKEKSGILILECQSVGHPTPVIRWKKYDGHVPSKCQQYSKRGHGILTCPNFQQSDQGAYSCVAENYVKLAESQPKSIAKCINTINCGGFRVMNEERIEHCLECYCSGKTTRCQNIKSNLTINKFPFPNGKTEIFASENGLIHFIPTKSVPSPSAEVRKLAEEITYCTLTKSDFQGTSFLKSFGRSLVIPKYKGKADFLTKAPDLIIRGNGLSLMYTVSLISPPNESPEYISARFWPGNWHRINKQAASREDLMKVLSNVDTLFVRCEYRQGNPVPWNNATVSLESSIITDFATSVSYVEKCYCPVGYDGLSCETCATGYKKKPEGNDFICEKVYVPTPCQEGYLGENCNACDTAKGFIKKGNLCVKPVCHPDGSASAERKGKCICKVGVTGEFCDECQNEYFHLNKNGCRKCWCSGVTNQCKSSSLYRTVISNIPRGGYNSSDGRNFWLLPSDFRGNRLTSYGGYLNYTMKYKPWISKQNSHLTVEFLSVDDVTLTYTHREVDTSKLSDEKSWSVPITETGWTKSDKSTVSRGEFLTVLSKIKAIYIESPYHLSSGLANLTSTRMGSASAADNGNNDYTELALAVEHCNCPKGYTGLSCESCSDGYYRKRNGTIIQCIKCNCSNCDPEFGCPDCPELTYRDNPENEKMPVCKPCPCNGNGISCVKDDLNQIFCRCKSGFTGMHCENIIPKEEEEFTIAIMPRKIRGKTIGTTVSLNCSFFSTEEMVLVAKKSYNTQATSSSFNHSRTVTDQQGKKTQNFEVLLEDGLEAVECFVYDGRGKLAGHVVAVVEDLITVIKPVKITNCYSDRIDVKESEDKEIICEATGTPKPMVNWYRLINGTSPEKIDTSNGVHTIESASLIDNGTIYTCIAENSEGDKTSCTRILIVRKKCEVINIFPRAVRVKEGKNISLECKTTAKGSVTWALWNPHLRTEQTLPYRVNIKGGHLHITDSKSSDSGTYICSAQGENGKINKTVLVTIEQKRIPPAVTIQEYDKVLTEGENFTITCLGTGKPIPAITWKKLNGTLASNVYTEGRSLNIRGAVPKNTGIYQCEGHSSSGIATAYISIEVEEKKYLPNVNISEDNIKVHAGQEVTLVCLAIGYPRPKLSWFAPNVTFKSISRANDSMVLIEPQASVKEEITFKATKEMDGLTITCAANNEAGRSEKVAVIKILQSKGSVNETVEFVRIGSYFELVCDFAEDSKLAKLGGLVGDECPIPNGLMIPSVQSQHNGTYVCMTHSDSKKIINLVVVGFVPKFSSNINSYLVLPVMLESSHELRVEMSFNPTREDGLLLRKDKFRIYLEKSKIHLSVYSNAGDFLDIKMNSPIHIKMWFSLAVTINKNYVDVTVYNEKSGIHERKTEDSKNFNVSMGHKSDSFFVGGFATKRHPKELFFRRSPHFDGCISRLKINHHEYDIVKESSYSQNVTLCRRCFEEQNLCHGNGKCLDAPTQYGFICVCSNGQENKGSTCPKSCAGKGCETQLDLCKLLKPCSEFFLHECINHMYSLQCKCAYGYSGTTCEKVQEYSFCVKGNGYVRLPSNFLERRLGKPEIIRMGFTLQKPDGQLLWQGDKHNHLSLEVADGKLRYLYLNQHSKLSVHGEKKLEMNTKHTIIVKRINGTVIVELNGSGIGAELYRNSTNKFKTNRVTGDIYLGNVPDDTDFIGHHVGLIGCIHYVSFGDKAKINLQEKEIEKFSVFKLQKLSPGSSESAESAESAESVESVESAEGVESL